jgi:hypothetical protein
MATVMKLINDHYYNILITPFMSSHHSCELVELNATSNPFLTVLMLTIWAIVQKGVSIKIMKCVCIKYAYLSDISHL